MPATKNPADRLWVLYLEGGTALGEDQVARRDIKKGRTIYRRIGDQVVALKVTKTSKHKGGKHDDDMYDVHVACTPVEQGDDQYGPEPAPAEPAPEPVAEPKVTKLPPAPEPPAADWDEEELLDGTPDVSEDWLEAEFTDFAA